MALQFTGQAVFVALGKAKRATFFSIFRKVIIVVPLTVLSAAVLADLGVDGVFWAEPISNLIGGCACFLYHAFDDLAGIERREKVSSMCIIKGV